MTTQEQHAQYFAPTDHTAASAYAEILCQVSTKYGAPMGRREIGSEPPTYTSGPSARAFKTNQIRVYDRQIRLNAGGYDRGGAYWGTGAPLRVRYTRDLSFIQFYREDGRPIAHMTEPQNFTTAN